MNYYCVTLNTFDGTVKEREIGCYINKDIARKVWDFMHEINNGNFEIKIKEYKDECVRCDAGLRLKNIYNGRIVMICEKLDRKEYVRLINIEIPTDVIIEYNDWY